MRAWTVFAGCRNAQSPSSAVEQPRPVSRVPLAQGSRGRPACICRRRPSSLCRRTPCRGWGHVRREHVRHGAQQAGGGAQAADGQMGRRLCALRGGKSKMHPIGRRPRRQVRPVRDLAGDVWGGGGPLAGRRTSTDSLALPRCQRLLKDCADQVHRVRKKRQSRPSYVQAAARRKRTRRGT